MALLPRPALASLPRSTRDNLIVLAACALVVLVHLPLRPLWVGAAALGLLGWRGWLAWHQRPLPGRWPRLAVLVLCVAAIGVQFRSIIGADAGASLVLLLLAGKALEMQARRDAMVLFFLGFFSLMTAFIASQSLLTALAVLLALWALLAALLNAHRPVGQPPLGQLLRQTAALMAAGVPLMVVLFVFFPRLPPLWGLPTDSLQGRTGLSQDMQVGQVASLAQDSSVALRVRFTDAMPHQQQLYFRGPVLSQFDGQTWSAGQLPPSTPPVVRSPQAPIAYEVTLEPHRQNWLLTLDATTSAPDAAQRPVRGNGQLQWLTRQPITEVLRYQAHAQLDYRYGSEAAPDTLAPQRRLPPGSNPRTQAWGQALRQAHGQDSAAIVQAALAQLRNGDYRYTLAPGVFPRESADAFWFDIQQGFCEHIASAFVVLMRAADVPARIVTGYQGGERNSVDGLWTVRQSDAHAWAEVWLPGQGWQRIDPTAAVAPARIELLQRLAPAPGLLGQAVGQWVGRATWLQLRANWEALNHRWNSWVLNYNSRTQNDVFDWLALGRHSALRIALALAALAALLLAAWMAWHWQQQRKRDPWLRLYAQACQRLGRYGIVAGPHPSPRALARAVQQHWGANGQACQEWLLAMEQWRYAPPSAAQRLQWAQLRQRWRALPWPSSPPR